MQEILTTGKLTGAAKFTSEARREIVRRTLRDPRRRPCHRSKALRQRVQIPRGLACAGAYRATTLTPTQWIGLKYYEEFKQRIPREEVSHIATAVREAANTFMKDEVRCHSRWLFPQRQSRFRGDIDVLVECRDVSLANDLLMHILNDLRAGSPSPRSGNLDG